MRETTKSVQVPVLALELGDLKPDARNAFIAYCQKVGIPYTDSLSDETEIFRFDKESIEDNIFIVENKEVIDDGKEKK